jgi:membrane protein DedA with SNARE-associated domain
MILYSTVSYLIFSGLVIFLSMKLVENLDRLKYYFEAYKAIVWPLVVLAVAMIIVRKVISTRKRQRSDESSSAGRR